MKLREIPIYLKFIWISIDILFKLHWLYYSSTEIMLLLHFVHNIWHVLLCDIVLCVIYCIFLWFIFMLWYYNNFWYLLSIIVSFESIITVLYVIWHKSGCGIYSIINICAWYFLKIYMLWCIINHGYYTIRWVNYEICYILGDMCYM